MGSYVREIDVACDPSAVWAVTADLARWPDWLPTVSALELLDPGPLHRGTRARVKQPRLPSAVWEVTAYDEGRSFTWQSASLGVTTVATHEIRPSGGGSRLVLSIEQTGPAAGLTWLMLGGLTRRYVDREAEATRDRATGPG